MPDKPEIQPSPFKKRPRRKMVARSGKAAETAVKPRRRGRKPAAPEQPQDGGSEQ